MYCALMSLLAVVLSLFLFRIFFFILFYFTCSFVFCLFKSALQFKNTNIKSNCLYIDSLLIFIDVFFFSSSSPSVLFYFWNFCSFYLLLLVFLLASNRRKYLISAHNKSNRNRVSFAWAFKKTNLQTGEYLTILFGVRIFFLRFLLLLSTTVSCCLRWNEIKCAYTHVFSHRSMEMRERCWMDNGHTD